MCGFVEVLRIKRRSQSECHTRTKDDIVSESGDTTIIDLGLQSPVEI